MPRIIFKHGDGRENAVDIPVGVSLMRGAVDHGVPSLPAECGGVASCGTCKVVLDEQWGDRAPPKSQIEASMLEDDPTGTRLSCQLLAEPWMEGLIAAVPDDPYA